jgi:hypothetical protein
MGGCVVCATTAAKYSGRVHWRVIIPSGPAIPSSPAGPLHFCVSRRGQPTASGVILPALAREPLGERAPLRFSGDALVRHPAQLVDAPIAEKHVLTSP